MAKKAKNKVAEKDASKVNQILDCTSLSFAVAKTSAKGVEKNIPAKGAIISKRTTPPNKLSTKAKESVRTIFIFYRKQA